MLKTLVLNNSLELSNYGIKVSHHETYNDDRGNLTVAFNENFDTSQKLSRKTSKTFAGCFRGMHIQTAPSRQEKITSVVSGKIMQAFMDLDKSSVFFGLILLTKICASDNITLRIPSNFAHGFYAFEDTVFDYICIGEYNLSCELSINPGEFLMEQNLSAKLSEKDQKGINIISLFDNISSGTILI